MEWKKVSDELCFFLDNVLAQYNCCKQKMFGCPVYFINNNMFAGVQADNLFIRLSEQDRKKILAENDEVTVFEPVEGRQMKEYIVLPESLCNNQEILDMWLKRSFDFVSTLPPKETKRKKN